MALQKTDNYLATSLCVLTQYDDVVHRKTQLVKSFDVLNLIKYTKCLEFMYYNNQLRFAYIDLKFYTFGLVYLRHSLLILFLYLRTAWIFFCSVSSKTCTLVTCSKRGIICSKGFIPLLMNCL